MAEAKEQLEEVKAALAADKTEKDALFVQWKDASGLRQTFLETMINSVNERIAEKEKEAAQLRGIVCSKATPTTTPSFVNSEPIAASATAAEAVETDAERVAKAVTERKSKTAGKIARREQQKLQMPQGASGGENQAKKSSSSGGGSSSTATTTGM